MMRDDVVVVIVGHSSHLASLVLVVFCAAWIANIPVHGLALLLIARGRQGSFIPLVAAEAMANIVLTVCFVEAFGPIGAAEATLLTIAVSNLLILPYVVRREFGFSTFRVVWWNGAVPVAVGLVIPAVIALPFYVLHPGAREARRSRVGLRSGRDRSGVGIARLVRAAQAARDAAYFRACRRPGLGDGLRGYRMTTTRFLLKSDLIWKVLEARRRRARPAPSGHLRVRSLAPAPPAFG